MRSRSVWACVRFPRVFSSPRAATAHARSEPRAVQRWSTWPSFRALIGVASRPRSPKAPQRKQAKHMAGRALVRHITKTLTSHHVGRFARLAVLPGRTFGLGTRLATSPGRLYRSFVFARLLTFPGRQVVLLSRLPRSCVLPGRQVGGFARSESFIKGECRAVSTRFDMCAAAGRPLRQVERGGITSGFAVGAPVALSRQVGTRQVAPGWEFFQVARLASPGRRQVSFD